MIQLLDELSGYLANCHLPLRIFIIYLTYFILVLVFDESTLRFDFHCVSISPPHLLTTSPSHHLTFYLTYFILVLVFDEYISQILYLFWCSMNLHCVSIFTAFRFHHLTFSPPHLLTTSSSHHLIFSPPHLLTTSPSHHLTFYLTYFILVLVFDESTLRFDFTTSPSISPILYWFWCSMNISHRFYICFGVR
ncbi:hypothetical protein M2306_000363 [Myroides gitamensis]|nr:hypothetical protein [Myroides gitamensis]